MNIYYPIRRLDGRRYKSEIPEKTLLARSTSNLSHSLNKLTDLSSLNSVLGQFIGTLAHIRDEIAYCEHFALSLYFYANDALCLV